MLRIPSRIKNRRGATMVEFALLVSVFVLIIMGLLEFSLVFFLEHYVANAAHEGVRIGVRANNYDCWGCDSSTDRQKITEDAVKEYLTHIYENHTDPEVTVNRDPNNDSEEKKTLVVTVEAENFMPAVLSGLIPGFSTPETITFEARGEYEDPDQP